VKKLSLVAMLAAGLLVCLLGTTALAEDRQVFMMSQMMLDNINPTLLMGRPGNMQVASLIYDSLVIRREDTTAGPEIAESWQRSDDLTWVFHIREGMTWQDGNEIWAEGEARAVTAHDVVFSLELHKKYSPPLMSTLSHCVEIVALDDYTVQITTDIPMERLLEGIQVLNMACIFPPEAATEHENGVDILPIGSGPFELQEFVPGTKAVLTKNEDYWIPVKLDEVQQIVINDPFARVIAFEAGEVDFLLQAPTQEALRLLDLGYIRVGSSGAPYNIGFNVTAAPFDDYRVREGISLLLDVDTAYRAILPEELTLRSYGQQGPWNVFNYDPDGLKDFDRFNIDEGLSMLADAGWADSDGDGWLDKDSEKLEIDLKTWNGDQVEVLTILVTQLQQAGIDAEVLPLETATYAQDLVSGNSDIFFDYMYGSDTGLYALYHSSKIGASNTHYVADPVLDALLDAANQLSPADSGPYWKAVERLAAANRYFIPMWFSLPTNFIPDYVKEFTSPMGFLELVNVERNVYLDK
jgi:peptide/nickel transport system substrate-binding protein